MPAKPRIHNVSSSRSRRNASRTRAPVPAKESAILATPIVTQENLLQRGLLAAQSLYPASARTLSNAGMPAGST